jgi:transcriptional regulator with XRE-family HTH domain
VVEPDTTDIGEDPKLRFAQVVREAREQRGWTQDQLAEAAGVARPTIQRWETGKTGTPEPDNARRVFLALGLDPRLIPVILGYATPDEMGLPARMPRVFTPTIERAIAILEDPKVPAAAKEEWVAFLAFRAAQEAERNAPKQAG